MYPISVLDLIPEEKVKFLCRTYLSGIEERLGGLFYVYIKDFYLDEQEVEITVSYSPKENTIMVSRYMDWRSYLIPYIPDLHEKTVLQIETCRNKNPLSINKYNLYNQLSPINHKANLSTYLCGISINCKLQLDGRFLRESTYFTLELDPSFHLLHPQVLGVTYAVPETI